MKTTDKNSIGDSLLKESIKHGPVVTFLIMLIISGGIGVLIYMFLLSEFVQTNDTYRTQIINKELENQKTEKMIAEEDQFRGRFEKIVGLYDQAKPLLPEETEISDVLGQVETAAKNNGVTLTGLQAVKESVKSPKAGKLYEREIPALVTGSYPQVVKFFTDVSNMPRILVVRDYSIVSLKDTVSAGFTLVAYHAPPPSEKPKVNTTTAVSQNKEVTK